MTDSSALRACVIAGAFVLALGPATASAHRRARAQRPDRPMERLQAFEAGTTTAAIREHKARSVRADLLSCLGFGAVVVGLISTLLIWDDFPWSP